MEETFSTTSREQEFEDNSEEIGWVSYGMLATATMVCYQFFLIYFLNSPSTITVKLTLSLAIGVLALWLHTLVEIYWKCCCKSSAEISSPLGSPRKLSSRLSIAQSETCDLQDVYIHEDLVTSPAANRGGSLWKYLTSFLSKENDQNLAQDPEVEERKEMNQPLLGESYRRHRLTSGMGTMRDSTLNVSNGTYRVLDRYESQENRNGNESLLRRAEPRDNNIQERIMERIREQEQEIQNTPELSQGERWFNFLKTWNLTFGTLLLSLSQYAYLYCFESRRFYAHLMYKGDKGINYIWIYGQVLAMVIVPLLFLVGWKIYKCNKPLWIMMATTLIPFLVVLSLVLTSWKFYGEGFYFTVYCFETGSSVLFAMSLAIIKYTQKSYMHTFKTMVYSDLILSVCGILLKYMGLFPYIYSERELLKHVPWYTWLSNPLIIVVGIFYLLSNFLISHMMWQSQERKSSENWTSSKIRITTLLCLKAFECEILTLISLFLNSDELGIVDMMGMFVFIIAILIMSCDDTSTLLIQTVFSQEESISDYEIREESHISHQKSFIDKNFEYFVVETDESLLVKHREAISPHYKEASIQRFNLKFYGINIPTNGVSPTDEKDLIRQGLTDYTDKM